MYCNANLSLQFSLNDAFLQMMLYIPNMYMY